MPEPLPAVFLREIAAIFGDHERGAMALARRAALAVHEAAEQLAGADRQRQAAARIVGAQPGMAPLYHLAAALEAADPDEESIRAAAEAFLDRLDGAEPAIRQRAAALIPEGATVLTHSASGTAAAFLLSGRAGRVICTESRPMKEGVALARRLGAAGVAAELVVDAGAGLALEGVHAFVTGADRIGPDAFVNKIGTRMIALAAADRGIPVYVLASELKLLPGSIEAPAEAPKPSFEVLPEGLSGVDVRNYYFESTPLRMVSALVTERGTWSPDQVPALCHSPLRAGDGRRRS
jgi:translation initiation factor eIF-2B subunit delta